MHKEQLRWLNGEEMYMRIIFFRYLLNAYCVPETLLGA